jgi:hypothetical protein
MSAEKLAEAVAEATDRRRFLRKAGVATLAVVTGALGLAKPAYALVHYHCCWLCKTPCNSCATCVGGGCTWCWPCCENHTNWACCECHASSSDCSSACVNIAWSFATPSGSC